jgi:hypothetical protein
MSEDQLKLIAELILINDSKIDHLIKIVGHLLEENIKSGVFSEQSNSLLSDLEQLTALSRDAEIARENMRKFLGLS